MRIAVSRYQRILICAMMLGVILTAGLGAQEGGYRQQRRQDGRQRQQAMDRAGREQQDRDIRLEEQIRMKLRDSAKVTSKAVLVEVYHGDVYLYGVVDSEEVSKKAQQLAQQPDKVGEVHNNLRTSKDWKKKSDRQLREDVKDQLFWSAAVDSDDIEVIVTDSDVTLTGTVDSHSELRAAVRNAFQGGARMVTNRLQIAEDPDVSYFPHLSYMYYTPYGAVPYTHDYRTPFNPQEPARQQEEEETRHAYYIRDRLRDENVLKEDNIQVVTMEDKVVLFGRVSTDKQRQRAEKIVSGLPGVETVDNRINLDEDWEKKNDRQLKEDIQDSLFWSWYVDDDHVKVSVQDGVVTLKGTVEDNQARASALEDAYAAGAKKVKMRLSIDPNVDETFVDQRTGFGFYPGYYPYYPAMQPYYHYQRGDSYEQMAKAPNATKAGKRDTDILADLKDTFAKEEVEKNDSLFVAALNGQVYLYGYVKDEAQKRSVEQAVQQHEDVDDVVSNLMLVAERPAKSDRQISEDLQAEFYWSSFVDSDRVSVIDVRDGVAQVSAHLEDPEEIIDIAENVFESGAMALDLTVYFRNKPYNQEFMAWMPFITY